MESYSREFALFIDGIRIERGLSRVDLIDDIISLSQYKRYLRGVAPIPNNVVLELADRLKYNITDLYTLYTRKYSKEDSQLRDVYNFIREYRFEDALKKVDSINEDLIISGYYKTFYNYCKIHIQHKLGKVSDIHVLSMYSDLIDYPSCMKNESFNFVEINVLNQIVILSSLMDNFEPADLLFKVISDNRLNYSRNNDNSILPGFYYTLARVFFVQRDYSRSVEICRLGIDIARKFQILSGLPHLFFLKGRSLLREGKTSEAYISMKKCFMQLLILGNEDFYNTFQKLYEEDFDLPIDELLKDVSDVMNK